MHRGYTKSWRKKYSGQTASRGLLYIGAIDWFAGNANWIDKYHNGTLILRGQIVVSRKMLSELWKVSEQTTRTILKNLEKDGFLTIKSTKSGTIVTVLNFDTYQPDCDVDQPTNQPTTNQRLTNDQPLLYNYKNYKNDKNNNIYGVLPNPVLVDELKNNINNLYNRKESTKWSDKEIKKLKEISKRQDAMQEFNQIKELYESGYKYRRKDIITLLNNWTGELDRAVGKKPMPKKYGI